MPITIPGTTKHLCPHCARALDFADFDPGHAFCRVCDVNRFASETIRQNSVDRRLESISRLMWFLNSNAAVPETITPRQRRQLRSLVIDFAATDPEFRDTLIADLQMLKARQERITHVSNAQDIKDVKNRTEHLNA